MAARADQRAWALARVDYQTDLAEPNCRRRRTNHAERLAGRGERDFAGAAALRATGRAEMLDIPLGGAERRVAVQMDVNEGACVRRVDLDQRAVRRFHISEQQTRSKSGYRRVKRHAIRQMFLVIGLHRRAAPPEMPDGAVWRGRRRRRRLVEEQINILALDSVKAGGPSFLRHVEGSRVKINRLRRINRIQVNVMEDCGARCFLRRSSD